MESPNVRDPPPAPAGYQLFRRRSSWFSFLSPKQDSQENKIAIYDPLERKLWIDDKKVLETETFVRVPIRGTDTRVQVYMEMGAAEKKTKVFVGSVDLGRLGKWVKGERKKGRMQHIYVRGQIPEGFGTVEEE